jgi:hypothetical protein
VGVAKIRQHLVKNGADIQLQYLLNNPYDHFIRDDYDMIIKWTPRAIYLIPPAAKPTFELRVMVPRFIDILSLIFT